MTDSHDQQRYPPQEFFDDFGDLLEAAAANPQLNLRQWAETRFQEKHPDITNEQERGQLLLNALRYYDTHRAELNQPGGIVLGQDKSLVPPEVIGALWGVVMAHPWQNPNIAVPVPEFLKLVERQRKAWGEPPH